MLPVLFTGFYCSLCYAIVLSSITLLAFPRKTLFFWFHVSVNCSVWWCCWCMMTVVRWFSWSLMIIMIFSAIVIIVRIVSTSCSAIIVRIITGTISTLRRVLIFLRRITFCIKEINHLLTCLWLKELTISMILLIYDILIIISASIIVAWKKKKTI